MKLKRILWNTIAAGLTLGAAVLGLALDPTTLPRSDAAPPAAQPPSLLPDFPHFPGYVENAIGDGLAVNGQRVSMRQFYTDEPASEVADFYDAEFGRMSKDVTSYALGNAIYFMVPTDDGRFMQVMILGQPDGGALVVPSLSSGPILPGQEADDLPVPLPERHEGLTSYRSDDGGRTAIGAQFTTPDDMETVGRFYKERLEAAGWQQLPGSMISDKENGVMRFRGENGRALSVGVQGLDSAGSFVFVLYEEPGK